MRAKRPHSRSHAVPDAAATVRRTTAAGRSSAGMAALVALTLSGCATPGTGDPRDPLEPLNRGIYEINEAVDRAVIRPVAEFYTAALPDPARTGVSNFFGNLYDYWNAINNLLQGKVGAAISDVGRIALNTTVGLLGFVDVASRVGLEKSDEDLGQTLAWWGIGHGPYLVLPLLGPSSLRDGTSVIAQVALDPVTRWIDDEPITWTLWSIRLISLRASLLGAGRVFDQAASDRYAFLRDAYFQRRRSQLWDGNPPREKEFSAVRPSVVQLAPVWQRPSSALEDGAAAHPAVPVPGVEAAAPVEAEVPSIGQVSATGGAPMAALLVGGNRLD